MKILFHLILSHGNPSPWSFPMVAPVGRSGPRVGHCLVKLKRNRVSDAQVDNVEMVAKYLGNRVKNDLVHDHWRHGQIFNAFKAALRHSSSGNFPLDGIHLIHPMGFFWR